MRAARVDGGGGLERGEVKMGVGRAGYVGFARLEDGSVDVAAAIDPAGLVGRSKEQVDEFIGEVVAPIRGRYNEVTSAEVRM